MRQSPFPVACSPHWEPDLSGVKIYDEGEEEEVEDEWGYVVQEFPDTYFEEEEEEEGAYEIIEVQDLPPHLRGTIV